MPKKLRWSRENMELLDQKFQTIGLEFYDAGWLSNLWHRLTQTWDVGILLSVFFACELALVLVFALLLWLTAVAECLVLRETTNSTCVAVGVQSEDGSNFRGDYYRSFTDQLVLSFTNLAGAWSNELAAGAIGR